MPAIVVPPLTHISKVLVFDLMDSLKGRLLDLQAKLQLGRSDPFAFCHDCLLTLILRRLVE